MLKQMQSTTIRVAAIDLDDTLLRTDGTLSPRNWAALRHWQEDGRRIVIATGRPGRSVNRSLPEVLHGLPLVCYNGAEVYVDGHKVYENLIAPEDTRQIVTQVQQASPDCIVGLEV